MENAILTLCRKFNIGQSELSKKFGIPYRTVQDWFAGKRNPPSYVVYMIKKLLEIDETLNLTN